MPPRTIDNLGPESYTRYAEDQTLYDKSFTSDPGKVVSPTIQDFTRPAFTSQFKELIGLSYLHPQWAFFLPPKIGVVRQRLLFTSQILPFMGNEDKKEAVIKRIKQQAQDKEEQQRDHPSWEKGQSEEEMEEEKTTLLQLFACLQPLNRDMIEVLTRMRQFQKG